METDAEELMKWLDSCSSEEICEKLSPLLSKLGTLVVEDNVVEVKVHAVCCLLKKIVPVIKDNEVLNGIHEKVNGVLVLCVESVSDILSCPEEGEEQSQAAAFIDFLVQILSALSPSIPLLHTTLTAVSHTLSLCNQVDKNHGQVFEHLITQLGALFKAAYNLLKASLDLVSSLETDCVHNDVVLSALTKATSVALNFDPSMLVLCWKALGKLLCKVKGQFPNHITLIIKELCVAMETKATDCFECAPVDYEDGNPVFQKLLRVCRFLGTMLLKLTQECLNEAQAFSGAVLKLLLTVHSKASSYVFSIPALTEIDDNVLLMTDPLLSLLAHSEHFLNKILNPPVYDVWAYGRLVCICSIIKLFPQMEGNLQDYCLEATSSLVEAQGTCRLLDTVFASFTQCYLAIRGTARVRGVMCNGQSQRIVTLYEHVATHLCALFAVTPAHHIHTMEYCLLKYVMSPWQPVSLLSCDVWIFFARCCSQEVVEGYCCLISKLLLNVPFSRSVTLGSLCSRFLSLLPPTSQHTILSQLSGTPAGLRLWAALDPTIVNTEGLTELVSQVVFLSVQGVSRSQQVASVCTALDCLSNHHQSSATLVDSVISMATDCSSCQLFCHVMKFLSLQTLSSVQMQKVLCSVVHLLTSGCDETTAVSVCGLLRLQASHREAPVLDLMSRCLRLLISNSSWLVRELALESFRIFAEMTSRVSVVESCVPPGYTDKVITFLNKKPCVVDRCQVRAVLRNQQTMVQSEQGGVSRLIQEWVEFVGSCDNEVSYSTMRQIKQLSKDMVDFCNK